MGLIKFSAGVDQSLSWAVKNRTRGVAIIYDSRPKLHYRFRLVNRSSAYDGCSFVFSRGYRARSNLVMDRKDFFMHGIVQRCHLFALLDMQAADVCLLRQLGKDEEASMNHILYLLIFV